MNRNKDDSHLLMLINSTLKASEHRAAKLNVPMRMVNVPNSLGCNVQKSIATIICHTPCSFRSMGFWASSKKQGEITPRSDASEDTGQKREFSCPTKSLPNSNICSEKIQSVISEQVFCLREDLQHQDSNTAGCT